MTIISIQFFIWFAANLNWGTITQQTIIVLPLGEQWLFCGNKPENYKTICCLGRSPDLSPRQRLPIGQADSGIILMSSEGITVAGLSRIFTGFPINRVMRAKTGAKLIIFFSSDKIEFYIKGTIIVFHSQLK